MASPYVLRDSAVWDFFPKHFWLWCPTNFTLQLYTGTSHCYSVLRSMYHVRTYYINTRVEKSKQISLKINFQKCYLVLTLSCQQNRFRFPDSGQIASNTCIRTVVFRVHVSNNQISSIFNVPSEIKICFIMITFFG